MAAADKMSTTLFSHTSLKCCVRSYIFLYSLGRTMSRMYPRIFWKNRAFDDVIKRVGFESDERGPSARKACLTPGLGGPAGSLYSILSGAEAIGLQQKSAVRCMGRQRLRGWRKGFQRFPSATLAAWTWLNGTLCKVSGKSRFDIPELFMQ